MYYHLFITFTKQTFIFKGVLSDTNETRGSNLKRSPTFFLYIVAMTLKSQDNKLLSLNSESFISKEPEDFLTQLSEALQYDSGLKLVL